ncbi:hypothetical protein [Deinococcus fonticola]|uniref:hypothetical protein n=1 Tax=Deinococcus fonticola TaxID=2528713 RepID=UPI0014314E3A|nr:hypothetical protein [Deinococcus fonticola]
MPTRERTRASPATATTAVELITAERLMPDPNGPEFGGFTPPYFYDEWRISLS